MFCGGYLFRKCAIFPFFSLYVLLLFSPLLKFFSRSASLFLEFPKILTTPKMFGGNMAMVNDYIMFRLLMEETDRKTHSRQQMAAAAHHRNSLFIPRGSVGDIGQGNRGRETRDDEGE